jgi:hypothetical protein
MEVVQNCKVDPYQLPYDPNEKGLGYYEFDVSFAMLHLAY